MKLALCLCVSAAFLTAVHAGEVATGKMLGAGYDSRAFYTRGGSRSWQKTYIATPHHRPEAAGRLMNLRIAQALFHDEWMTEAPFNPARHTERVIEALATYKDHGVLAINVSLQGGNPAYELSGHIRRDRLYKLGREKGAHISAFRSDGSLKPEWMKRLLRLVRELDRRGMMLNLMYFYQGQDELFENTAAIDRAAINATDWLIDNNCRNVIIEIANEHNVAAYDHDRYIHKQMGRLIELARRRFQDRKAPFRLPVSASTGGGPNMPVYDGVSGHADLVIIHGNGRAPEQKRARVRELAADAAMPGPIHMNEDDNGRDTTPENLAKELASCDAVFDSGGSWGYMPWRQLQVFPFRHILPARSAVITGEMKGEERDPAYFHAVLDHMRRKVMREAAPACRLSLR